MNRRTRTVGGVLFVILVAGCLSGGVGSQTVTPTDSSPAATPSASHDAGSPIPCVSTFQYWADDKEEAVTDGGNGLSLAVGFDAGATVMLVARENDTILGTQYESSERAVVADGYHLTFDKSLNGTHLVSVTAYSDTNHNKAFDPDVDQVCYDDSGAPKQTREVWLNFSSQ